MHKPTRTLLPLLLAACLSTHASAADAGKPAGPLKPQDFAYAVPLIFEGQDALYQTALPLSVYQHTVRSDLGDLRVFNAQGEVVPHMLRQPELSSISQPERKALAFFPLQGGPGSGLEQLSIRVKRNASGTLVDIGNAARPAAQGKVSGYLLDASSLKQAVQALELGWDNSSDNFVGSMQIEASDDLKSWHTIVRDAPLASLQFGGHSLLQKRMEFAPHRAKYLRLSWPSTQTPLHLNSIAAELAGTLSENPLTWLKVNQAASTDKAGEYLFDVGAHLPAQRIRIELPQMNTLVQAAFFSRDSDKDVWHPVCNTLLYKLHHSGQDLTNPDIPAAGTNHRYWLLRVEQKGGGLGTGMPEMQVGWQPHQMQFVTRGAAPFQLAFGSSAIKPAEFQIGNVLPGDKENAVLAIQTAQTGMEIALGGEARLTPAPLPHPWKRWGLWAVLGIAVMLLGWMAYRLVQQMERHDSRKQ